MDRLTNDETYSILKTHLEEPPSWIDIMNQKEKIYVALAEYERTGLMPDEIEKLKQENKSLNISVNLYRNTKYSCKLFPDNNCTIYHEYAVLNSKLNKAITLLKLAKENASHQCSTCAHRGYSIKMRCNAGGCLNQYKPSNWEWIYNAELQELIGGSENE